MKNLEFLWLSWNDFKWIRNCKVNMEILISLLHPGKKTKKQSDKDAYMWHKGFCLHHCESHRDWIRKRVPVELKRKNNGKWKKSVMRPKQIQCPMHASRRDQSWIHWASKIERLYEMSIEFQLARARSLHITFELWADNKCDINGSVSFCRKANASLAYQGLVQYTLEPMHSNRLIECEALVSGGSGGIVGIAVAAASAAARGTLQMA